VDELEAILGAGGVLARAFPGYEHRPQQLEMARAIAAALEDRVPLLVEAGTGTGKTLAYLVPAALSGQRVIVSTASKNLQEQLVGKDLPLLAEILGRPIKSAVLKGVSNYVCLRKYAEGGGLDLVDGDHIEAISDWLGRTVRGDRAELATVPEDAPAWRQVTTTSEARLGPGCPFFERCFVTRARRDAAAADVVVVNHHLFLADAVLRSDAGLDVMSVV
jgi:ATP-dependent DNA helicase DinG